MSADPGCRAGLDPEPQAELADRVAAVSLTPPETSTGANLKNGAGGAEPKKPGGRPHLPSRKLSLQERGTYAAAGGTAGTHVSPRAPRRPTVESKHVSISDTQVRLEACPH